MLDAGAGRGLDKARAGRLCGRDVGSLGDCGGGRRVDRISLTRLGGVGDPRHVELLRLGQDAGVALLVGDDVDLVALAGDDAVSWLSWGLERGRGLRTPQGCPRACRPCSGLRRP